MSEKIECLTTAAEGAICVRFVPTGGIVLSIPYSHLVHAELDAKSGEEKLLLTFASKIVTITGARLEVLLAAIETYTAAVVRDCGAAGRYERLAAGDSPLVKSISFGVPSTTMEDAPSE